MYRIIIIIIAIVICGSVYLYMNLLNISSQQTVANNQPTNPVIPQFSIGGDFSLIDQNGDSFSYNDLKGKYSLLYFGYTFCHDVCPTELSKIIQVQNHFKENQDTNIQVVFVTVDPNRDTPTVLKEYVELYEEGQIIALSGDEEKTKDIMSKYKIFASKVKEDKDDDEYYLMDHSTLIYFVDQNAEVKFIFRHGIELQKMIKSIDNYMKKMI